MVGPISEALLEQAFLLFALHSFADQFIRIGKSVSVTRKNGEPTIDSLSVGRGKHGRLRYHFVKGANNVFSPSARARTFGGIFRVPTCPVNLSSDSSTSDGSTSSSSDWSHSAVQGSEDRSGGLLERHSRFVDLHHRNSRGHDSATSPAPRDQNSGLPGAVPELTWDAFPWRNNGGGWERLGRRTGRWELMMPWFYLVHNWYQEKQV